MRFRMLGPLRVYRDGWRSVAAPQQRVVLAVLLINAGQAVSTEALIDAVWGAHPPRTAANTIAAYVLRLRRLIGAEVLLTRQRGYELAAADDDLDATLFEYTLASARREMAAGWLPAAAARLSHALRQWPGPQPPLADIPATPVLEHVDLNRLGDWRAVADAPLPVLDPAEIANQFRQSY